METDTKYKTQALAQILTVCSQTLSIGTTGVPTTRGQTHTVRISAAWASAFGQGPRVILTHTETGDLYMRERETRSKAKWPLRENYFTILTLPTGFVFLA